MNKKLIIFEIANNHMGDLDHGLLIIDQFSKIANEYRQYFDFCFKFQFRNLETFIHKDFKDRNDLKYIKRFKETALTLEQFQILIDRVGKNNFLVACTPFDENSVDNIKKLDFDILKIASCSFNDWSLLNKIEQVWNKQIIASTAGVELEEIDNVVSFFRNRGKDLVLMHCVGEYPTPKENFELNQIDFLKKRYPNLKIGFSSHEEPDEVEVVRLAIAKGAEILEKHIGIGNRKYELNSYSAQPNDIKIWLDAIIDTLKICGIEGFRKNFSNKEQNDLLQFKRGCFANKDIKKGEIINRNNIYYAFPNITGQLLANNMGKYRRFKASKDILKDKPILLEHIEQQNTRDKILEIVKKTRDFLKNVDLSIPPKSQLEISHHYGLDEFNKFGLSMLTIVNRGYCKKIIVLLPGQSHPEQYHKQKEETFCVLFGSLTLYLDNQKHILNKGDFITINPLIKHKFESENGCIIEELSSTHYPNDSFYIDDLIDQNKDRKTFVTYWK